MSTITTFQNLFHSQVETPANPNPRLLAAIDKGTLTFTLTAPITYGDGTTIPTTRAFCLVIRNAQTQYPENIFVAAGQLDATGKIITLAGTNQRGLNLAPTSAGAIDFYSGTDANASAHPNGSEVRLNDSPLIAEMVSQALLGALSHANKHSQRETFDNGVPAAVPVYANATARDAAITSPANGDLCYLTDQGVNYQYIGGAWANCATGTTANGSTTVAGKFEEATVAEQGTATATGGTGARLVPANANLVKTSSGAGDENKLAVLNASGKFADGFQSVSAANGATLTGGNTTDASALHTHSGFATFTYGGTITAGQALYLSATDGKVYPAKADAGITTWTFIGFALVGGNANDVKVVATVAGTLITGLSGLTASYPVYISSASAGAVTNTIPTTDFVYKVGFAVSSTALILEKGQKIISKQVNLTSAATTTVTLGFHPQVMKLWCASLNAGSPNYVAFANLAMNGSSMLGTSTAFWETSAGIMNRGESSSFPISIPTGATTNTTLSVNNFTTTNGGTFDLVVGTIPSNSNLRIDILAFG